MTEQRQRAKRIEKLRKCDAEVLAHALETFESATGAPGWLIEPTLVIVGLKGKAPVDMLNTLPGRDAVHQLLYRIEYGIPP